MRCCRFLAVLSLSVRSVIWTHANIAFSCRIDVMFEGHIGLVHVSQPLLALLDTDI